MSEERKFIRDDELPPNSQKSLVVHWDTATNEVWLDRSGLSIFDVAGMLQTALDVAELDLPTPWFPESEEDDEL